MRVVLQRVSSASVTVQGEIVGAIGPGLLLLVGVAGGDDEQTAKALAKKCVEMRIFSDADGRFNHSLLGTSGEALVVSQFTLLADARRGRRPNFSAAAVPEIAAPICDAFADGLRALGVRVATGRFGTHMIGELVNDGPVTIVVDSEE